MTELVTLDEYKSYKGIKNPNDDGKIQVLIAQISQLVESYCNRKFVEYYSSPYRTEWFDAKTELVYLTEFPVVSVISVSTSTDGGLDQTTLTENDPVGAGYFVDLEEGIVRTQRTGTKFLDTYNTPYRSLEIIYQAGYDSENLPEDLKLSVLDLVDYYRDEQRHPTKSLLGATIENPLPAVASHFPPHIKRVLDLYRYSP